MKTIKINGVNYRYNTTDKQTWDNFNDYVTTSDNIEGGQDDIFVQIYREKEKFAKIKINDMWYYLGSTAIKRHHYTMGDLKNAYLGGIIRSYIKNRIS